jgi:hypothetical protein
MSLKLSIENISSEFISIFAVLDGWCDGLPVAESDRTPLDELQRYLDMTGSGLRQLNARVSDSGPVSDILLPLSLNDIPHSHSSDIPPDHEALRNKLRDTLFDALCLMDTLKTMPESSGSEITRDALQLLEMIARKGQACIERFSARRQYLDNGV